MGIILVCIIHLGLISLLLVIFSLCKRDVQWKWMGIFFSGFSLFLIFAVCGSILQTWLFGALHLKNNWNWIGEFICIAAATAVLYFYPDLRRDSGVAWAQHPGSMGVSIGATMVLAFTAIYSGLHRHPESFNLETLLFQFFMPSISEELLFRGVYLALLTRALGDLCSIRKIPISAGVLILITYFGFGHGVSWSDGSLHAYWPVMAITGAVGAVLMLVRLVSGSIVMPMVIHTIYNVLLLGLPMVNFAK